MTSGGGPSAVELVRSLWLCGGLSSIETKIETIASPLNLMIPSSVPLSWFAQRVQPDHLRQGDRVRW